MAGKVIRYHDPEWESLYAREASRLDAVFDDSLQRIFHIGGTSIYGIYTKPIIDILVQLASFDQEDDWSRSMETLGYDARGEYGIVGRRYFSKKVTSDTLIGYHVHVYEQGSSHIQRHLAFRDFLNRHPEVAREYSDLKRSIADASGRLPDDYPMRKSAFVERVEQQAMTYFAQTPL